MTKHPRAELWAHLNNHELACLLDWWVSLEKGGL